jgi:hypothetical protein
MRRYILYVADADEIPDPVLLTRLHDNRALYYNVMNLDGIGFIFLDLEILVYVSESGRVSAPSVLCVSLARVDH